MTGTTPLERFIMRFLPLFSLIAMSVLFYLLFPIYEKAGGWIIEDLGSIPFLLWIPVGGVLGLFLHIGMKKNREIVITYSKRVVVGLMVWFFLSIMISLVTETGDVFARMDRGPLFKAWAVLMFVLLSMSPALFGVYSILGKKRWSMGATVTTFFLLAMVCMIFSQGRYALALEQDPFLSLMFIWAVIAYVESISWNKRYLERDINEFPETPRGDDLSAPLLRRQIYYTLLFTSFASMIAFAPVVLFMYVWKDPPSFIPFYEVITVFGRVLIGLLFALPLICFAVLRRWMDRKGARIIEDQDQV